MTDHTDKVSLYDKFVLHSNFKTGNTLIFIHNIEYVG